VGRNVVTAGGYLSLMRVGRRSCEGTEWCRQQGGRVVALQTRTIGHVAHTMSLAFLAIPTMGDRFVALQIGHD
jgi:hypothetical protein